MFLTVVSVTLILWETVTFLVFTEAALKQHIQHSSLFV